MSGELLLGTSRMPLHPTDDSAASHASPVANFLIWLFLINETEAPTSGAPSCATRRRHAWVSELGGQRERERAHGRERVRVDGVDGRRAGVAAIVAGFRVEALVLGPGVQVAADQ